MVICTRRTQGRWYLTFSTCYSTLDWLPIWLVTWPIWLSMAPAVLENMWVVFRFFYLVFVDINFYKSHIKVAPNSFLLLCFGLKRDTIQAATSFALRNQLPSRLQDQMISHLSLKFRTDSEGLQQQETLDALPKAIRSSISQYLFFSLVQKVYLFEGVSNDLIFQLVRLWKFHFVSFKMFRYCFIMYLSCFVLFHGKGFWDESWIFST